MIYINKYIRDGFVTDEIFRDETEAKIAARRGDKKFNFSYAVTYVFETIREGVNKFVQEVVY
jgi:hypothetical protein